ncbi:MAG: pyridoxamine 5'-phosphate oxidase family protein [Acidaminococcales bacterium]|nr:pyridoxamine 5'-phosphate oxidase family protein [Acidaminococcales bacterium]
MQEVLKFLAESKVFFLATAEGKQPRVRPLGFFMEYGGKLCFCTSNQKDMYKQMKDSPLVEICATVGRDVLRVTGKAVFVTSAASKQKALEVMPALKAKYAVDDKIFEIFAVEDATATTLGADGSKKTRQI